MIYLCDKAGDYVDGKKYVTPWERQRIIERWRMLMGRGFKFCLLQIAPDVNETLVDSKGVNKKEKYGHGNGKYIDSFGKMVRPKSKYKNKVSLGGTSDYGDYD
jgi:hypothetical protein